MCERRLLSGVPTAQRMLNENKYEHGSNMLSPANEQSVQVTHRSTDRCAARAVVDWTKKFCMVLQFTGYPRR